MKLLIDEAVLRQVLDTLEKAQSDDNYIYNNEVILDDTITNLRAAIEQMEKQEPAARVAEIHMTRYTVEWINGPQPEGTLLYTHSAPAVPEIEGPSVVTTDIYDPLAAAVTKERDDAVKRYVMKCADAGLLREELAAARQQIAGLRMALETIAYCALSGVEKIDVAIEALGTTAPKEEV